MKLSAVSAAVATASLSSLLLGAAQTGATEQTAGALHAVSINSIIVEGAPPMESAITYRLQRRNGDGWEEVTTRTGPELQLQLPSGDYRVEAAYGNARRVSSLRVDGGPMRHTVDLNAGEVSLAVTPGITAQPLREKIKWQIQTWRKNAQGKRDHVAQVDGANPLMVLPEGRYLVTARTRTGTVRHTVEVDAGRRYDYTLLQQ